MKEQKKFERTKLHDAVVNANFELVKTLLEQGEIDIHAKEPQHGHTVLHKAAYIGNLEIAECLVEALKRQGKGINRKDKKGETPLYKAVFIENLEIARLIINALKETGQEINLRDKNGITPLNLAVRGEDTEMVKLLINALKEAGQEINPQDEYGETPLHVAVRRDMLDIVKLLIDAGADPHIKDNKGEDIFALLKNKDKQFRNAVLECIDKNKRQEARQGAETFILSTNIASKEKKLPHLPRPLKRHILTMAYPINGFEPSQVTSIQEETIQINEKKREVEENISRAKQLMVEIIFGDEKSESAKNESLKGVMKQSNGQITCTTPLNSYGQNMLHLLGMKNYLPQESLLTQENLLKPDNKGRRLLDFLLFSPYSHQGRLYEDIEFRMLTAKKLLVGREYLLPAQDNNGNTVLHKAAMSNHQNLLGFMMERCEKVHWEIQNEEGKTPLHLVCKDPGNYKFIETLIDNGVDFDKVDKEEKKPLDCFPTEAKQQKQLLESRLESRLKQGVSKN